MALLFSSVRVGAVPAQSVWRTFTQSDGTTITVRLCGDENMHYYLTEDGVPLLRDANGDFCYADALGFSLKSSGVVAHEQARRSPQPRLKPYGNEGAGRRQRASGPCGNDGVSRQEVLRR